MSNSYAERNNIAVVGIGNYLRGDDGAGIHAIDMLRSRAGALDVDFIDGATAGPGIRFMIEERDKVIFIDAGTFGAQPGEFVRFTPEDVRTQKITGDLTLHEFDLISFLTSPPQDLILPEDIAIYCIEAKTMAPTPDMSPEVQAGLETLVTAVIEELNPSAG